MNTRDGEDVIDHTSDGGYQEDDSDEDDLDIGT